MNPINVFIPDDWRSAWTSLRDMGAIADRTSGAKLKWAITFVLPFALGGTVGFVVTPPLVAAADSSPVGELAGAIVGLGAILTGFLVTQLLFTGRHQVAAHHSYEVFVQSADRLRFLLVSQAITVVASLLMTVFAIVWLGALIVGADLLLLQLLGACLGGFAFVAVLRMLLMPFQIFELHQAALDDQIQSREASLRQSLEREGD